MYVTRSGKKYHRKVVIGEYPDVSVESPQGLCAVQTVQLTIIQLNKIRRQFTMRVLPVDNTAEDWDLQSGRLCELRSRFCDSGESD